MVRRVTQVPGSPPAGAQTVTPPGGITDPLSVLGALPEDEGGLIGVPPGVQFELLPIPMQRSILNQNLGNLPATTMNRYIDSVDAREAQLQSSTTNRNRTREALQQFGLGDPDVSEQEFENRVNANFGEANARFFGSTADKAGPAQGMLGAIRSLYDEDFRKGRAAKAQIRGVFDMQAYDSLRGAGQISNFELQSAAPSVSLLNSEGIDDETAQRELRKLDIITKAAEFRALSNIIVDQTTGQEWQTIDNQPRRVYTTYNPETGSYDVNEVPIDEDVFNIPSTFTEAELKESLKSVPNGRVYIYKGIARRKGAN